MAEPPMVTTKVTVQVEVTVEHSTKIKPNHVKEMVAKGMSGLSYPLDEWMWDAFPHRSIWVREITIPK